MYIYNPRPESEVVNAHEIDIEQLVKTKLPPLPGSIIKISELLRDVNVSHKAIASAIGYDPLLSTRILRLANSPMYALQRRVATIGAAVSAIGLKAVYETVLLGVAADSFAKEIRQSKTGRAIWEHLLAVAFVSRELGHILGIRGAEESFTCGLLHDIGKILLLRADPQRFAQIENKHDEEMMLEWENALFGYTHAQVGALVAHRWGLPEAVCYVILNHHNPSQARQAMLVAHIVNVADEIANLHGYGLRSPGNDVSLMYSESVILLNLTPEQLKTAWIKVQEGLHDILQTLT
jgi:putative nucleotidyltransferase with HDIG domain